MKFFASIRYIAISEVDSHEQAKELLDSICNEIESLHANVIVDCAIVEEKV